MKVIGLGAPDCVRIRFEASEIGVLVDVLREQRTRATLDAAETYGRVPRDDNRPVDDRHDELRTIESLLMQLEDQQPDEQGRVVLTGETEVMCDVVHDGAREALQRLDHAHDGYRERASSAARAALLDAAKASRAWVATLASFDRVDRGPDE
jgi:hypothetical protein